MSEFCVKCSEYEANIEILHKNYGATIEELKAKISKLETEVDSLSLDVAFYGGNITNLSCNNK